MSTSADGPPPGWRGGEGIERKEEEQDEHDGSESVDPPPGWVENLPKGSRMRVGEAGGVHAASKRRRITKRSPVMKASYKRRSKWSAVGASFSHLMRGEMMFEVIQLIHLATDKELSLAWQYLQAHDRRRNPWRPVQGTLSRIERYMTAKGRHKNHDSVRLYAVDKKMPRNGLVQSVRRMATADLAVLHEQITSTPRLKKDRVQHVDESAFLSKDLWIRILSFLEFPYVYSTLSRVAHDWLQIICSAKYWSSVHTLKLGENFPEVSELGTFFERLNSLKTADFSSNPSTASKSWITTNQTKITDHVIRHLAKCKLLERLDLSQCERITDSGFIYIAGSCHNLRYLNLTDCTNVTDRSLGQLAFGCHELEELYLKGCYQLTDKGIKDLTKGCKGLQRLNLRRCRQITDEAVRVISVNLKNLEFLDLYSCHRITDQALKNLGENCPKLEHLVLGCVPNISDSGLNALSRKTAVDRVFL